MTCLITGSNGQLGTELRYLLDEQGIDYLATDAKELDITDEQAVLDYFEKHQPDVVFHCAAYTAVDKAETEGKALNEAVNVLGTKYIAQAAQKHQALLIYVSTDYVFDGKKEGGMYRTDDPVNPLNEYGRTKWEGEEMVRELCSAYYIVRTSWVFGNYGHNFVYTMLKLAKTHDTLTVVNDQIGRPTWTRTLAEFLLFLDQTRPAYGTYHLSNQNSCSWYEFAQEILKDTSVTVLPVDSSAYPQVAQRPMYSVMDLSKTEALGFNIPTWQEALHKMMAHIDTSK